MAWRDNLKEFAKGPKEPAEFAWQLIGGIIAGAVLLVLGRATVAVSLFGALVTAVLVQQRYVNRRLVDETKALAGISLIADDVLREASEVNQFASGIESQFRAAAERRAWEAEQIELHGRRDAILQLTYSVTFEAHAAQNLRAWNHRYEQLSIKLAGLGFRVFPPAVPSNRIEGEPSPAATKMICQREALTVAADALRRANDAADVPSA